MSIDEHIAAIRKALWVRFGLDVEVEIVAHLESNDPNTLKAASAAVAAVHAVDMPDAKRDDDESEVTGWLSLEGEHARLIVFYDIEEKAPAGTGA